MGRNQLPINTASTDVSVDSGSENIGAHADIRSVQRSRATCDGLKSGGIPYMARELGNEIPVLSEIYFPYCEVERFTIQFTNIR